ncbi:universal stress protein [Abyssalbus ytuae]|uniref:Universal stress protein n=1 Tax=Abyssalbus ytuae TaxID=2926907 RepID=A0A9E7D1W4_9FLAO|nr:universal stress protein [Abyssalbus ytuae]UOB17528.1 universal stress protein [Abyssalbus ytuae]
MKNILLPTDFSDNAWNAIEYALQIFKDEECKFYLLNAYSPPLTQPSNPITSATTTKALLDIAKKASEDGLKNVLKKVTGNFSNVKHQFETISEYDFFLGAVKTIVADYNIDIIVMGTKGASGIKEVIIGSNAAGVIGHVKCPVLAIPEKAVFKPLKEIAFATDYDYYCEKGELKPLTEIAEKFNASVKILHALDTKDQLTKDQEQIKRYLDEMLGNINHSFHTLTRVSLETATRVFTQSRDIDMLCIIAKHHSFFERLFGKPRVEEISFHIKIPYLVLHEYKS